MAAVKAFDAIARKFQRLKFNLDDKPQDIDENSSSSSYEYCINDKDASHDSLPAVVPSAQTMKIDLLERKIRRLVSKLKKNNIEINIFEHHEIHYGPTLGRGGEGIVQRCTVQYNGILVDAAVKTVLNNTDDALEMTFDEIEMLCLARDRIVTTTLEVYGVAAVPDRSNPNMGHLVIITEAGIKNALQLYQDETIPLHVTYDAWNTLAVALHCIHKKGIIHQDLKPENILITGIFRDNYGAMDKVKLKVIDLGMACLADNGRVRTDDVLGTTGYHAPEVLYDSQYDFKADLFVLGVTFCVMLLPQHNLRRIPLQNLLNKIHEAKERGLVGQSLFFSVIQPAFDKETNISSEIIEMICVMLERVDRRTISLLEIAAICTAAATKARQLPSHIPHDAPNKINHDSGIADDKDGSSSERPTRRRVRKAVKSPGGRGKKSSATPKHAKISPKSSPESMTSSLGSGSPICKRTRNAKRSLDVTAADDAKFKTPLKKKH